MIKLVIFDFDGTLADTRDLIINLMHTVMRTYGWRVASSDECASTIGLPLKEGFKQLFPECSEEEIEHRCTLHRQYFMDNCWNIIPPAFPGVPDTLAALRNKGVKMTMASARNKPSLVQYLVKMGIDGYFDMVVGPEDVTQAKPWPEPVLKTMAEMGFTPDETLVIGDTCYDILMGVRAGAHTCGVSYGVGSVQQLQEAGAEYIIDSFDSLPGLLG